MSETTIRGLLFDKDGTLFDFNASWMTVVDQTLAALARSEAEADAMAAAVGYDRPNRRFLPGSIVVAGAVDESAHVWAQHRPDLGVAKIEDLAIQIVDRAVAEGALVPAVPDLPGLMRRLVATGYTLGIATHDSEAAAVDQIGRWGLLDAFDFIAGYDSGHGLKPGPGMMHAFCTMTGLRAPECAMIGDSVHDLGVAPSSGAALAIGVLTGPAGRSDLEPHADHVLDSIGELPLLLQGLGIAPGEVGNR